MKRRHTPETGKQPQTASAPALDRQYCVTLGVSVKTDSDMKTMTLSHADILILAVNPLHIQLYLMILGDSESLAEHSNQHNPWLK